MFHRRPATEKVLNRNASVADLKTTLAEKVGKKNSLAC